MEGSNVESFYPRPVWLSLLGPMIKNADSLACDVFIKIRKKMFFLDRIHPKISVHGSIE